MWVDYVTCFVYKGMARMRVNQLSSEYYRSDSIDSYFFRTAAAATATAAGKKKNFERIKMCDLMAFNSGPVLYHQRPEVATEELLRPKIVTPLPLQTTAKVGSEFKLLCLLTGYPTIEIGWYLNGDPIEESGDGRVRFDNNRRLLVIRDLKESDAGSITFQASNKYGEVSSSSFLEVVVGKRERYARSHSFSLSNSPKPIRRLMHALNRMKSF